MAPWLLVGIVLASSNTALGFTVGNRVQANGTVNVRSTPAGTVLGTQAGGNLGTISSGPQTATLNGTSFTWWNVNWDSGFDGWVADIGLTLAVSAPGGFTLSNDPPVWDTSGTPAPAVQLRWSAASGATTYDLYRNGSLYLSGLTGTTFYNSAGLTSGQTYTYAVVARNSGGNTQSNTITVGPMPSAPLIAPGSFSLTNDAPVWDTSGPPAPAVQLLWTAASGATSYDIYRNGSLYASGVTGTAYYNSAGLITGQTYTYYVIARNSGGARQSNTVTIGPMPGAPVSAPGPFTLSNNVPVWDTSGTPAPAVQLQWTASSGATSYDLYRNGSLYAAGLTGTSFYNNDGLTAGQTYAYYLVARNIVSTQQSNIDNILIPAGIVPGPAPTATTSAASSVTTSTAQLNGVVNPNGVATIFTFKISQNADLSTLFSNQPPQPWPVAGTAVNVTATPLA